MRIWVVNHYADPPDGMATRSFDLSRRFVESGNPTTIFTSNFSHYRFSRMRPIQWGRLWHKENVDGVRLVWIQTTPYRSNDWKRIMNMLSFAAISLLAGVIDRERPGLVIGVTVHPMAALAGFCIAS